MTGWEFPLGFVGVIPSWAPAIGMLLMSRYIYNFLFGDVEPSEKVVNYAKAGFVLFVVGYAAQPVYNVPWLVKSLINYFGS